MTTANVPRGPQRLYGSAENTNTQGRNLFSAISLLSVEMFLRLRVMRNKKYTLTNRAEVKL